MRDCFITSDYNNFIEEILAKLKQANLATNSDANAVSQCANKRKEKTEILKTFDLSYFLVKNFFRDEGF